MTRFNDRKFCVYWIKCSASGDVVYVGISEVPQFRLYCHKTHKSNPALREWLIDNWDAGMEFLHTKKLEQESARDMEASEIFRLKKIGQCRFNRSVAQSRIKPCQNTK